LKIKYYKNLCKFCDKVLLSKKSTLYTHSITSLHVLKEHPVLLSAYFKNDLIRENKKNSLIKKIYLYFLNFVFEKKNFRLNNTHKKGSKVLILSNLINKSHANKNYDFYYGEIETELNKKKIKTFTVLRNFTGEKSSVINKIIKNNKILLFEKTSFLREIIIIYRLFCEYYFIKKNFIKPKIKDLNTNFLSLFSLRGMVSNLRLYYQIKDLIEIIKPKLLIIPFEGHAWERLIIKMVKDLNKDVKIASYQFTVTTNHQHSIFRPLKASYNPDIILTSGKITKKKFQKKYKCPVKILGSNKYKKISRFKVKKQNIFIIIPEAFYSETDRLLNFTLDVAKILPDHKFIFRCHPMMKSDEFINKINLQDNVELSNKDINDDFKRCKYVVFRGSAAVFEAVSQGLKPIYLDVKNETNINPFKNIFLNSCNVIEPEDIFKILRYYESKKINKDIIDYSNNYFAEIDTKVIRSLL
tara:strand:+ start:5223 stop:6629 length:1407 start_codon:yes stop_codon:yes gene_type:complete